MHIEYKNIHLHYKDLGTGKTIVLLHGFLENSSIWDKFLIPLSRKSRVICIDLLGHGKTPCLGYIHTMEDMATAVHSILKHNEIEQFTLIGHSMGGYVALALADIYPNQVNGLCLVNSTAKEDSPERKLNRERAIKAVKQNHKSFISLSIPNLFAERNREKYKNDIMHLKSQALLISVQGIVAALEGMKVRPNRLHILKNTTCKKLMIIGKKDPVLNYNETILDIKNTDVKKVVFPDGHMSFIENESLFLQEIMHFIDFL
jgi:pimeloyl-ACP methyl ester carboxylesterase